MKAQVEDLRKQLKAKSRIIQSLKEEIKTPLFQSAQKKNEVQRQQNPFSPILFDWIETTFKCRRILTILCADCTQSLTCVVY